MHIESAEHYAVMHKYRLMLRESEERALVYLFRTIHDSLNDEMMIWVIVCELMSDFTSVDTVVHALNALSPIKDKIRDWDKVYNWSMFTRAAHKYLIKQCGWKVAEKLMKVII